MNKSQKELRNVLLTTAKERPYEFSASARSFLSDLCSDFHESRALQSPLFHWLTRLGEKHLGHDHPLVRKLRPSYDKKRNQYRFHH